MHRLIRFDTAAAIPELLKGQICDLLEAEWPATEPSDSDEDLVDLALHPVFFVLTEDDQVLSYARTIWALVPHLNHHVLLYGLGDVVTRPDSRRRGHGSTIVREATAHIRADSRADAAILLTRPDQAPLYVRSRWDYVPGLRVVSGEERESGGTIPMMLFLSAKVCAIRAQFPSEPLVLPGTEW